MPESSPLVSVVTPFHNTGDFLAECVESVLCQTYQNWEYILVNNRSDDGAPEIGQNYASRFPGKIRLIHTKSFLSQVQNYNFALSQISPSSKYCKMVQADDWVFPDCIRSMVEVAEAHPSVGIVAAYGLDGERVALDGLPYPSPEIPGREACRLYFLKDMFLFGTPTSLLMRSDLVRSRQPFYEEWRAPLEDADVCFRLLKTCNMGFVHQVLTYSRRAAESITSRYSQFGFLLLGRLTNLVVHGKGYLSEDEYDRCLRYFERRYFLYLSRCALRGRNREFWEYHRRGLASIGYSLDRRRLLKWMPRATLEKTWEAFWSWWDRGSCIDPNGRS